METADEENVSQDPRIISECPTLHREKKRRHVGFNLRKSIAWNPAFSTEEGAVMLLTTPPGSASHSLKFSGVLDNMELSVLSGSPVKPTRTPGSGAATGTVSPLCRSGTTSLLKKVTNNSRGKGRKLFSPAKTFERDELTVLPDKRSERSTQKCMPPRPPAGFAQKKVPNSSAAAQLLRTPKKSQPSIPTTPRSTSSATSISQSKRKIPPTPVKTTWHTPRVDGPLLKSETKPLTKFSRCNTEKGVATAVTTIRTEASGSLNYGSFSAHTPNRPSNSIHAPSPTSAKPSGLRMPSPSVGFFAQGKAPVSHCDTDPGNTNSCFTENTSSFVKPPRYTKPEDIKGKICQAPALHGNTAQGNAKGYFAGNTSSLVKPPRYKQPEGIQSRTFLTKLMLIDSPTDSKPVVHPVTNESSFSTLISSLPDLEHANVCSLKESLLEKNRSSRNGTPDVYTDASHGEGKAIMNTIEPIENSNSLEVSCPHETICSSTKSIARNKLTLSCISSQVCTLDDLNYQCKPDICHSVSNDMENSLSGERVGASSLSEVTLGPDILRDLHSCDQQNTDSFSIEESTICADQVPGCGSSIGIKLALADSTSDLYGSFCNEAQSTSAEAPNTDDRAELGSDNLLIISKEAQLLHVASEFRHEYGSRECTPVKPTTHMPCVDQEIRSAHLNDLETITTDSGTDSFDSLAVGKQPVLSEEPNTEESMDVDTDDMSALEDASPTEKSKPVKKSGTNTIRKDHLNHLIPFTEEWIAAMEACGEEVLLNKTGAVQNSPTDKTTPEPNPWSPVKRKAQDVGPFDCTKYCKSVEISDTP